MNINGISFRWLNGQCFEIKLSNGKTIITDPMLRDPLLGIEKGAQYRIPDFSIDEITGADYIIVNHSHGDHVIDLGVLAKKFNSTVICHEAAAYEIARVFDLLPTNVFPVASNDVYYFDDFKLETFHGMHRKLRSTISGGRDMVKETFGVEGLAYLGDLGSLFNVNFVLTTNENIRIGFSAGDYFGDTARKWQDVHPNIVLRHRLNKGPQAPLMFADVLEKTGAQLLIPMHHEDWVYSEPGYTEKVVDEVNAIMENKGIAGRALAPQRCKWYELSMSVSLK